MLKRMLGISSEWIGVQGDYHARSVTISEDGKLVAIGSTHTTG